MPKSVVGTLLLSASLLGLRLGGKAGKLKILWHILLCLGENAITSAMATALLAGQGISASLHPSLSCVCCVLSKPVNVFSESAFLWYMHMQITQKRKLFHPLFGNEKII